MRNKAYGFTIVELLIVIVVIAILAAISAAAYSSISTRANDSAVQSDLSSIAKQISIYRVENGVLPDASPSAMSSLGVSPSKNSYGEGYDTGSGEFNLVYCRGTDGSNFAVVGWSKSGQGFVGTSSGVKDFNHSPTAQATVCNNTGVAAGYSATWLYYNSVWRV